MILLQLLLIVIAAAADTDRTSNTLAIEYDFQGAIGSVPDKFLILEGDFKIEALADGKMALVLPGSPIGEMGVLLPETADTIEAVIQGEASGRRQPRYGVGLYGVQGVKLKINPAKKSLEISLDEKVLAETAFDWQSNAVYRLKLTCEPIPQSNPQQHRVTGSIRIEGAATPLATLTLDVPDLPQGRPSLWGTPYADKPIVFHSARIKKLQSH